MQPVADWIIDDGIRSLQDPLNYTAQLCLILTELDISFIVIPEELKNLDERVALVKSHLIPRLVLQRFIDFDLKFDNFSCDQAIYSGKSTS